VVSRITLRRECVAGNLLNSNILRYQAPWRRYALYRVPFWFTHIRFGVCRFYIHECSPDYQTASRNQAFFSLDTPDHLLALRHHIDLSLLVDYTATIGNILRVASQQVAWSYEFGLSSSKLRRNDTFQQNCSTIRRSRSKSAYKCIPYNNRSVQNFIQIGWDLAVRGPKTCFWVKTENSQAWA